MGAMAGARLPRGKKRPTACMTVSAGVLGAMVKMIEPLVRGASVASVRAMSAPS
jgi:hypothetical protein